MRRNLLLVVSLALLLPNPGDAKGCWCCTRTQSLLEKYFEAEMIVVGRLQNAVQANNALPNGQTELVFNEVIKPHKAIKDRKSVFLPRHVQANDTFLIAMEVYKGEFDAYFAMPLDANGAILKYVRGAIQLKDKSKLARLRYNVDFLADPCKEVANSAAIELSEASYDEIRKVGAALKPEPLAKSINDPNLTLTQRAAYAMLLAHCGAKEHGAMLRKHIDAVDTQKDSSGGLSSLMFAYVLLEPDHGFEYVAKCSVDGDATSFLKRYSAFSALRELRKERKDLFAEKKWDAAMLAIMEIPDMSDFAIEELRKVKAWQHDDAVLDLSGKPGFKAPIVRRAILRFALQSPTPRARAFVNEQSARDAAWVSDTKELLELESTVALP